MKYITVLLLLSLITVIAQGETVNYCHDEETNKNWQQLMTENGHHPEWQAMYRTRKKLCKAVDNKQLTIEEATQTRDVRNIVVQRC